MLNFCTSHQLFNCYSANQCLATTHSFGYPWPSVCQNNIVARKSVFLGPHLIVTSRLLNISLQLHNKFHEVAVDISSNKSIRSILVWSFRVLKAVIECCLQLHQIQIDVEHKCVMTWQLSRRNSVVNYAHTKTFFRFSPILFFFQVKATWVHIALLSTGPLISKECGQNFRPIPLIKVLSFHGCYQ